MIGIFSLLWSRISADLPEPSLPADGLIRTIQPPREISALGPQQSLLIGLGILLLLVLAALAFYLLRRKKQPAPPPSPYQVARQHLREVFEQRSELPPKEFASEVSLAVRVFIEKAFAMPAPERTTEEFLPEIRDHPVFRGELSKKIARLLTLADLAKFARQEFGPEEKEKLYHVAEEIVDKAHLQMLGDQQPAPAQHSEQPEEVRS